MPIVKITYWEPPETGEPHIYDHGVSEDEVEEVLRNPGEELPGRNKARLVTGQTEEGRYLKVVFVRKPEQGAILVVTAYDLSPAQLAAYRRRRRKKR